MTLDLFSENELPLPERDPIGQRAVVLRGFAKSYVDDVMPALAAIELAAPFRHLITPGGFRMSVAITNCGALGWTSDRNGYRYSRIDPDSGRPWPDIPEVFMRLADQAAGAAGFDDFVPDACLINRYEIGTRLTLHQDKNERDYAAPIVSVSLGIPAVFLFGGDARADKAARVALHHGDVVVWGGPDRLRYHGILPLKAASHPVVGEHRINFTFRKAG
jgi:alkylated DNA repair protein (DNA oxidative demethylase)